MTKDGKILQYGNFNVTFFEHNQDKPMLTHFIDIIYPAFRSGIERKQSSGTYSLLDVSLQEIDSEIVLTGYFIKRTSYEVYTTFNNGSLKDSRSNILTSPFSKFVIYLRNHRMVLVKNEKNSPDLRSFNATIGYIINEFIRNENKIRQQKHNNKDKNLCKLLPPANVNVVGLPKDSKSIQEELDSLKKITQVTFRFFPLNSDIDTSEFTSAFRNVQQKIGAKRGSTVFPSPKNNAGLAEIITETEGTVASNISGETVDGEKVTIKSEDIATTSYIPYNDNLMNYSFAKIVSFVKLSKVKLKTSEENNNLYMRLIHEIRNKLL